MEAKGSMASLQAALKSAIQVEFQLEDTELAPSLCPISTTGVPSCSASRPRAGQACSVALSTTTGAFARVAVQALQLCHFDPRTGEDLRRAPNAREDCEAACYDCLMSYTNQIDHPFLDRQAIRAYLMRCSRSTLEASPRVASRSEHVGRLLALCQSDLEREWLAFRRRATIAYLPTHSVSSRPARHGPTSSMKASTRQSMSMVRITAIPSGRRVTWPSRSVWRTPATP